MGYGFYRICLLDITIRYSNRVMQNPPWMILPLKHIKTSVDQGFSSTFGCQRVPYMKEYSWDLPSGYLTLFNIAMENDPFIDDVPII